MRHRVGFDQEMQDIISGFDPSGAKPRLLLHVCCAPCSSVVLERLSEVFEIIVYFDNPNLDTEPEYNFRAADAQRFVGETGWAERVIIAPYDPSSFLSAAHGLENEPEGGARCAVCFSLRLSRSAFVAKELHCDYFTTTLTLSPRKDASLLNQIGLEAGRQAGLPFLPSDFKKQGGYQRSIALCREYRLYRQNYCGCVFSKRAMPESRDWKGAPSPVLKQ